MKNITTFSANLRYLISQNFKFEYFTTKRLYFVIETPAERKGSYTQPSNFT